MSVVKFLSSEKLVEYLDEELRIFLNAKEIYEINHYGWLADGCPDPEYIGLAMWQTEPPTSHDKFADFIDPPNDPTISQTEMGRILQAGLEFEELMKSARHSIGLTYLYHKDPDNLTSCYNYHSHDTTVKLGMGTDRLRELFINAFSALPEFDITSQNPSSSDAPQKQQHIFCQPFRQIRDQLAEHPALYKGLLGCVDELIPLIEQTAFYRLAETNHSYEQVLDTTTTNSISGWYKLLVRASNQVFLAEYLLRHCDQHPSH